MAAFKSVAGHDHSWKGVPETQGWLSPPVTGFHDFTLKKKKKGREGFSSTLAIGEPLNTKRKSKFDQKRRLFRQGVSVQL